jgi:2-polyprenyl-6-methoxyphenol hydroxylase-like FAD-dependent oxidoreductase
MALSDQADVLIIGAGIAGLTAANALQSRGVEVQVIEREDGPQAVGAGILLHPNALSHLAQIVRGRIPYGVTIPRQLVFGPDGRVSELPWEEVWGDGRRPLALHRHRLVTFLYSEIAPNTVKWGTTAISLVQRMSDVEVRFSDGTTQHYRIVIGADGIRSWTRTVVDPQATVSYLGQIYWRTTTAATSFECPEWRVWRRGPNFFGAMPIGESRVHVFLQAASCAWSLAWATECRTGLHMMAMQMGSDISDLVSLLDEDAPIHVARARRVAAKKWAQGRVVLIGDAAHASSPALTQGGALAIEDAAVLSAELMRYGLTPDALAAFVKRRQRRIAHVDRMSRLHLMLTESEMQPQTSVEARPDIGPVEWYRLLYGPLREAA